MKKYTQKEDEDVLFAVFLGIFVICATSYASYTTKSSVMFAEMAHGIADTIGLLVLYVAIRSSYKEEYDLTWVSGVSGGVLGAAGLLSFMLGSWHAIGLYVGNTLPIKEADQLLFASTITFVVVALQLHLTKDIHHLLHGHIHEPKATYFFSNKKSVHHASKAARTELLADLMQSGFGVLVGVVALFLGPRDEVRYLDTVLSISLGVWMTKRGVTVLIDR